MTEDERQLIIPAMNAAYRTWLTGSVRQIMALSMHLNSAAALALKAAREHRKEGTNG